MSLISSLTTSTLDRIFFIADTTLSLSVKYVITACGAGHVVAQCSTA
jgi:hypothetical protein